MSRVLLIGRGPLPAPTVRVLGFSQLRTAAFAEALDCEGIELRIVLLTQEEHSKPPTDWAGVFHVKEEGPGWLERIRQLAEGADGIVSAGPYNPARAAVAAAGQRPVWVDVPGDPMSELAALGRVHAGGLGTPQIAAALAACTGTLKRADVLSVISGPQRFATIGQLGLLGRTITAAQTPKVHVLPITANFGFEQRQRPANGSKPGMVIALSGAFNPWFNDELVSETLEAAFALRNDLSVVVTGGGLPGFYEAGYKRFSAWAAGHSERVTLHGWLPHGEMETVLRTAHVGLTMDREGPEPELGSRTRLLLFAKLGLTPASTLGCELSREWNHAGALLALENDPQKAGQQLASVDVSHRQTADSAFGLCEDSLPSTALRQWCRSPQRTDPHLSGDEAMTAELESLKEELSRIHSSPTWAVLNRLHNSAFSRFKDR